MKVKQTFYVHRSESTGGFLFLGADRTDKFFTCLGTVEMEGEFDLPSEADVRRNRIDSLRAEISKTRAKAQRQAEELKEELRHLLELEETK